MPSVLCTGFFLIVKQKSCDLLVLIFFTLNYVQWRCVGMCVCVLCSNKGGVRRRSHTLIHQPLNRPNVMLLLQSQVITLTLFLPLHHLHFLCCSPASCQICLCCQYMTCLVFALMVPSFRCKLSIRVSCSENVFNPKRHSFDENRLN